MGQDVNQGQIAERGVVGQFVGNGHDKTSSLSVICLYLTINDISIYFLFLFFKRILGEQYLLCIAKWGIWCYNANQSKNRRL